MVAMDPRVTAAILDVDTDCVGNIDNDSDRDEDADDEGDCRGSIVVVGST